MTELERLRDHMRESFGLQLERIPYNHSMFFGASPAGNGYVDIPVAFIPNVDPKDVYQGVDYNILKGGVVEAHDWSPSKRNDKFRCAISYKELFKMVQEVFSEIEGKEASVIGRAKEDE